MVAFFSPAILYRRPATMIAAVQDLGLTSGLKPCLDASDINSYSGSGQVWSDTSGGAYHFNRGTGSGSDSADPTFNGTAGRQSSAEYWSFDGGDFFRLAQANPTWVNNLHKNNALWAFAGWMYVASLPASAAGLFGTNEGDNFQVGAAAFVRTDGTLRVGVTKGTSGSALLVTSAATVNTNAWNFLAGQIDEAAGTGILQVNGTQESITSTYTSPSSSAAAHTLELGSVGNGGTGPDSAELPSGYRLAGLSMWEGTAPSASGLENLRLITKSKFGL
jgi:hypothetical protein